MEFVLKDGIHTTIAETMYTDILTNRSVYHYFIGGSYVQGQVFSTEAEDTFKYELDTRNEILAVRKVAAADVAFVVPRYDWSAGSVYDMFDDQCSESVPAASGATSMHSAMFYVVTDQFNVYKCLYNNGGTPSTVKPSGTGTSRFKTADQYVWKFMYTVPLSMRNKFMNNKFIPVQNALHSAFYSNGAIEDIQITNAGSGYTSASVAITGDGTGATATALLNAGQLVDVIISSPGVGYTYANIAISGNGTGASAEAKLTMGDLDTLQANVELLAVDGELSSVIMTNGGTGYPSATVKIIGDGVGATASAVLSNGSISRIDVTNPGHGYSYAIVQIDGTGTGASARAVMSPQGGHGKNSVYELYARRLQFYTSIAADKNQGFVVSNDYRQVGLLRNLRQFDSAAKFYQTNGSPLFVLTLNSAATQKDDLLQDTASGAKYRAYAVSGNKALVQNLNNAIPLINNTLTNVTRGGTYTVSAVVQPTIDKFSGDLLMIDNVSVVTQVPDQMITLKTAIKF